MHCAGAYCLDQIWQVENFRSTRRRLFLEISSAHCKASTSTLHQASHNLAYYATLQLLPHKGHKGTPKQWLLNALHDGKNEGKRKSRCRELVHTTHV